MKIFLPHENRYVELVPGSRLTVGRGDGADIRILDKRVSRHHAEISEENGKVYVADLGSHAGSFKNHEQMSGKTTSWSSCFGSVIRTSRWLSSRAPPSKS